MTSDLELSSSYSLLQEPLRSRLGVRNAIAKHQEASATHCALLAQSRGTILDLDSTMRRFCCSLPSKKSRPTSAYTSIPWLFLPTSYEASVIGSVEVS